MGAAARSRGNRRMTTGPPSRASKVTLENVEPAVMRRLDLPLRIRLDRLRLVLQAAMGWTNSYLYEFTAGDVGWGRPDPDFGGGPLPAAEATLFDVIEDTGAQTIHYVYDYGDNWDHVVRIERIGEPDPQALYPQLVAAKGRCPPEDVGGPPGSG
jgi:Plasmid pRiA4b ORF-3-like protein